MRTEIVVDMAEKDYRAHVGLSYSELKLLFTMVPAECKAYREQPKKVTPAMQFGTLFHLAILEPDKFKEGLSHHVRPHGMKFTTKEGKAWKETHDDLPILYGQSPEDSDDSDDKDPKKESAKKMSVATIEGMRKTILELPEARRVLEWKGTNETAIFAMHPETQMQLKGRCDKMSEDDTGTPVIIDLKTTDDARKFEKQAVDMGYFLQDPYYRLLSRLNGIEPLFIFIVVSTKVPYYCRIGTLTPDAQVRNMQRVEELLSIYSKLIEKNYWPAHRIDANCNRVGLEEFQLFLRE